jgi:hypothetical protein
VQSDDPAAVTEALVWAKKTYDQLGRLPAKAFQSLSKEGWEQIDHSVRSLPDDQEPPICAVHGLPMVKVQGKRGTFWSCHQKNEDGSWCSFKPLVR